MISKQFPTAYDVEQTVTFRTTSYDGLKQFLAAMGLVTASSSKKALADFCVNVLFAHQDYLVMRKLAQGAEAATSISGFSVRCNTWPQPVLERMIEDLVALRKRLFEQEDALTRQGAPLQKLSQPELLDGAVHLRFEYQRVIPGRVELMEKVDTSVAFGVERVTDALCRVVCYPQANQDVKTVQKLFSKLGSGNYEPYTISLDGFTQEQRIQFFDDLLTEYRTNPEWRLRQVTELTIRQPGVTSTDPILVIDDEAFLPEVVDRGDDEVESVGVDDLLSITQAALQGRNLRSNSFVVECEKRGFYFLSMTLELQNVKNAELIQVRVRFKLSPQLFEVVLVSMAEQGDLGEMPASFTSERQHVILRFVWLKAHDIWQRIYETIPGTDKIQLSFANLQEEGADG